MDAAPHSLPSPDSSEGECILLFVQISQINSSNHESHHDWEDPGGSARMSGILSGHITLHRYLKNTILWCWNHTLSSKDVLFSALQSSVITSFQHCSLVKDFPLLIHIQYYTVYAAAKAAN